MKLLVYSAKDFEIPFLNKANIKGHDVTFLKAALDTHTAIKAASFQAISIFSGDDASMVVLEKLRELGIKYITARSSGYNNIHLKSAERIGLTVANAPGYSPYAIAEHAVALLMALNRKLMVAHTQVKKYNFLQDNLMGFDLNGKKVGIIGTGNIGSAMAKIMNGFGCTLLAYDILPNMKLNRQYGIEYVSLKKLCSESDIISLHVPLTRETHHLIDNAMFKEMKKNVFLINTARGKVVDTSALLEALENGKVGAYGTDVYEKEKGTFFQNNSVQGIKDEQLKKLLSYDNVLLTPHQAFVTKEALANIAETTFYNLDCWEKGIASKNELGYKTVTS